MSSQRDDAASRGDELIEQADVIAGRDGPKERRASAGKGEVALAAVALALAGLVASALLWSGASAYADIARATGRERVEFRRLDTGERVPQDLVSLQRSHDGWAAYVTGRSAQQPAQSAPWSTDDERRHMADVRRVFIAAEAGGLLALATLVALAWRAARRGAALRLLRAAALAAGAAVALVGVLAVVSFDAAFLLFHEVLFPQGNFLFPRDSNLLALYPSTYWYAITLRIGVTFVVLAGALAIASSLALRRRPGSRAVPRYTPAG